LPLVCFVAQWAIFASMKPTYYAAILLLSACSTAPTATPEQAAIAAYIKANTNDPASYEAVGWGKPIVFTRKDSATALANKLHTAYTASTGNSEERAKLINDAIKLSAITDTTRIGTQLTHTYRAKNKLGALVLDSTQFVVYEDGQVVPR
jgi:hypothetical protein